MSIDQELTDEEIINAVQRSPPSDSEEEECATAAAISHTQAEECFNTCLEWTEQQPEATPMNVMLLRQLRDMAAQKRWCRGKFKTFVQFLTVQCNKCTHICMHAMTCIKV